MQKRMLGKSGLEVSAIGFGYMGISFSYGPALPRDEALSILPTAPTSATSFHGSRRRTARRTSRSWSG